jgi:hypothetical protein
MVIDNIQNIRDIREIYGDLLFKKEGVTGVGVGYKYRDGLRTSEVVILVSVDKKKDISALSPGAKIPDHIWDAKTDVVEKSFVFCSSDDYIAGVNQSSPPTIAGTFPKDLTYYTKISSLNNGVANKIKVYSSHSALAKAALYSNSSSGGVHAWFEYRRYQEGVGWYPGTGYLSLDKVYVTMEGTFSFEIETLFLAGSTYRYHLVLSKGNTIVNGDDIDVTLPSEGSAQDRPGYPMLVFNGKAYCNGGTSYVPSGSLVEAFCPSESKNLGHIGSGLVGEGGLVASFMIGGDKQLTTGATIYFKIEGQVCNETATYQAFGSINSDFTVNGEIEASTGSFNILGQTLPATDPTRSGVIFNGDIIETDSTLPDSPASMLASNETGVILSAGWNDIGISSVTISKNASYWIGIITNEDSLTYYSAPKIKLDLGGLTYSNFHFQSNPTVTPASIDNSIVSGLYGDVISLPIVSVDDARYITSSNAKVKANVLSDGGEAAAITLYGGYTNGGTEPNNWDFQTSFDPLDTDIDFQFCNLSPNTTFYYAASSANSAGYGWSSIKSFTTLPLAYSDIRTKQIRPTVCGISIAHYSVTAGTLGTIWTHPNTGHKYILSNNHVMANSNNASIGDDIYQPGPYDGGTIANKIGRLAAFVPYSYIGDNIVDVALCQPTVESDVTDGIYDIPEAATKVIVEPYLGQAIQKSGRSSGVTHGEIVAIDYAVSIGMPEGNCVFVNQIVAECLILPGDSGSVVLDENLNWVGLFFAAPYGQNIYTPYPWSIANKFSVIQTELMKIDIAYFPPTEPVENYVQSLSVAVKEKNIFRKKSFGRTKTKYAKVAIRCSKTKRFSLKRKFVSSVKDAIKLFSNNVVFKAGMNFVNNRFYGKNLTEILFKIFSRLLIPEDVGTLKRGTFSAEMRSNLAFNYFPSVFLFLTSMAIRGIKALNAKNIISFAIRLTTERAFPFVAKVKERIFYASTILRILSDPIHYMADLCSKIQFSSKNIGTLCILLVYSLYLQPRRNAAKALSGNFKAIERSILYYSRTAKLSKKISSIFLNDVRILKMVSIAPFKIFIMQSIAKFDFLYVRGRFLNSTIHVIKHLSRAIIISRLESISIKILSRKGRIFDNIFESIIAENVENIYLYVKGRFISIGLKLKQIISKRVIFNRVLLLDINFMSMQAALYYISSMFFICIKIFVKKSYSFKPFLPDIAGYIFRIVYNLKIVKIGTMNKKLGRIWAKFVYNRRIFK